MTKKCCFRAGSDGTEFPMTGPSEYPSVPRHRKQTAIGTPWPDWTVKPCTQRHPVCFRYGPISGRLAVSLDYTGTPVGKEEPSPILKSEAWPIFRE